MKAMILAAGRGERMRPLTDATPKPLLPVGGKPLIVWVIERLRAAHITELVVNVSHLARQIRDALGDGRALGVSIRYSHEAEALETAGGIAWALPLLDAAPFLVVNSDVYSDIDFTPLAARAATLTVHHPAHLVLVANPDHHPQGDFGLRDGMVTAQEPRLTFSGIGAYHPALFAGIRRGAKARLASELATPIAEGRVSGETHYGEWNDVGTPQRLAALDAHIMNRNLR
jgi:MurNAc alpha-1-phosphate uridylyltransferase